VARPPAAGGTGRAEPDGRTGRGGAGSGLLTQLALAVVCGGYAAGSALGWGSPRLALIMGDFGLAAAALVAAVSCCLYARSRDGRFRPAWLLFAGSSLMAAGGNAVWGWYEVVLERPVPAPSLADFFFLCFGPPAIIGLLVLAKRPVTRAGWICLALDAWLIAGSLLTLSWSLALAHTAELKGANTAHAALSLAYPLLDIALVSMVLALHFRRSSANRTAINTAIAALAMTVLCDALFTSPLLRDTYHSGQILDAGWFAGSLLLAYAPWGVRRSAPRWSEPPPYGGAHGQTHSRAHGPHTARAPYSRTARGSLSRPIAGSLAALTPYLAAAVCVLGILYNVMDGHRLDRVVLFTACTVVLALVVRQGIMLVDNISLTQELAQKENHFRSLVQGSSDVIMIAAPTGILRYVSPAAHGVYWSARSWPRSSIRRTSAPSSTRCGASSPPPPSTSPPPASSAASSPARGSGSTSSRPSTGTRAASSSTAATSPNGSACRPSCSTTPNTTRSPTCPTAPCSPSGCGRRWPAAGPPTSAPPSCSSTSTASRR
jgi:hypothetical protein